MKIIAKNCSLVFKNASFLSINDILTGNTYNCGGGAVGEGIDTTNSIISNNIAHVAGSSNGLLCSFNCPLTDGHKYLIAVSGVNNDSLCYATSSGSKVVLASSFKDGKCVIKTITSPYIYVAFTNWRGATQDYNIYIYDVTGIADEKLANITYAEASTGTIRILE